MKRDVQRALLEPLIANQIVVHSNEGIWVRRTSFTGLCQQAPFVTTVFVIREVDDSEASLIPKESIVVMINQRMRDGRPAGLKASLDGTTDIPELDESLKESLDIG
jgi:hypothetical protein